MAPYLGSIRYHSETKKVSHPTNQKNMTKLLQVESMMLLYKIRVYLVLTYGEWGALRLFFDKVGNQLGLDRILHMMVQTRMDRTRPDRTGPDWTRPD